ncbi:MAG: ABC transporter permease [Nocardiopsaceae bacterium]|nr:ABC transporter permease [Nocardiopsaceae bacterium]
MTTRGLAGSPAWKLVGRRLVAAVIVLWGVTFLTYAVMSALPNDTAAGLLGLKASPAQIAALNRRLGLNQPFWVRYWHWFVNLLHGNLGTTLEGQSVNHELATYLPVTMELLAYALVVSLVLAVGLAVLAARKPNGAADRFSLALSMLGLSAAPYAFAIFIIVVFGVQLGWFPVQSNALGTGGVGTFFREATLPAASLGFGLFAIYARVLRGDLVEQMQREDYITTARAKGLAPWRVLVRHALRNSMFTLITVVGLNLGALIGAAAIIETLFSAPGIGQELLNSISNHDVPMVEGIVLVFAIITVAGNLLADLLYAVLDPRIRYGSSSS